MRAYVAVVAVVLSSSGCAMGQLATQSMRWGTGCGLSEGELVGPDGVFAAGVEKADGDTVTYPTLISRQNPLYTQDAMSAKIQGQVHMEAVVEPDGTIGDLRVTQSLDKRYGLDKEALCAAKRWRFEPSTRDGVPVATLVVLVLEFRLH